MKYEPIKTLVKEVKMRCFYLLVSFCLSFFLCYQKSTQIVYLMVLTSESHKPTSVRKDLLIFREEKDNYLTNYDSDLEYLNPYKFVTSLASDYNFIYTNITEAFYATLQASSLISLSFTLPLLIYHGWCFFMPSRYRRERNMINQLLIICLVYMVCCLAIILYKLVPHIGTFLHAFAVSTPKLEILNQARIYPYISWLFYTVVNLFLVSFTPVIIYLLLENKYINLSVLLKNRKIVFLVLLMVGALVSPPDFLSQLIVTNCLFLFSECVIWIYLYKIN